MQSVATFSEQRVGNKFTVQDTRGGHPLAKLSPNDILLHYRSDLNMAQQLNVMRQYRRHRPYMMDREAMISIVKTATSNDVNRWILQALLVESRRYQLQHSTLSNAHVRNTLNEFYALLAADVNILMTQEVPSFNRTSLLIAELHLFADTVVKRHLLLIPSH